jgi:hypothetical protein
MISFDDILLLIIIHSAFNLFKFIYILFNKSLYFTVQTINIILIKIINRRK